MDSNTFDLLFFALLILGFLVFMWIAFALPMQLRAKQTEVLSTLIKDILNSPVLTKEEKDVAITKIARTIESNSEKRHG